MKEIKRYDISENWAHAGIIQAGDYCFINYCVRNIGGTIEEQIDGAFDVMEERLALVGSMLEHVVQMNCLFKNIWDIPVMEKVIKSRFGYTVMNDTPVGICGFYADHEYFMVCIYFNHFQNITEFARILYEEDYDLFQWFEKQFPERLCKCPNNRRIYFGSEPRRICGLSNRAEIVNPDGRDIDRALYVLRKYRNIDL